MGFLTGVQIFFSIVIGVYFLILLRHQISIKSTGHKDYRIEQDRIDKLRRISLTVPLSEVTRPSNFSEIIGQDRGLLALKAAICGPNPQHVIIYGEAGIGKTAAARVALQAAKEMDLSPFTKEAKFVEIDATTLRFDERGIADPLIGSVHDPIYQGAGAYGSAGIPQPKLGAVTKAHGGVLFIDEIGELPSIQMNKLLKVLEDRKVFLESAYYSREDGNIPPYIHDIFKNGLPADFRLVGATTRMPEEITPALRSRCMEIFFDSLGREDIRKIAINALNKAESDCEEGVVDIVTNYATNGRDAVNMIQTALSMSHLDLRKKVSVKDMEWVVETGQYPIRMDNKIVTGDRIGAVNGLAVHGIRNGSILEIEATVEISVLKEGNVTITGIIEEEEFHKQSISSKRKSTAKASVDNAITLLERLTGIRAKDYNIHINYPGGMPVDGPSAGVAIFVALYSALFNKLVSGKVAITGEISIHGKVYPVGGVYAKINAAKLAGVNKVIIPKNNYQETFEEMGIDIVTVSSIEEVIENIFEEKIENICMKAQTLLNA